MDQSKKTMRHFYCRDALWETFEQMANDFDCSIDYLVNEAMRHYARSKNYQSNAPGMAGSAPPGSAPSRAPPPPPAGGRPSGGMAAQAAPHPQGHVHGHSPSQRGLPVGGGAPPRPPGARAVPSASNAPPPSRPAVAAEGPVLVLVFNNQRYPVDKDQFIIGRGSKTSDLAIKDGNISRKHAAVIRRNGTYYIKDLGSTNGIDYKGMRIDNKRIDEGDVFHICDYEFRFTYSG